MSNKIERIAIINSDRCRPKKCRLECKRGCPVNRMGKKCIEVESTSKLALINEPLCIGCGICVKKCPFKAISIINLPTNHNRETTHRYSANSFKLHRLPVPRAGQVLGLVGTNGIGKTTALKIFSNKLIPNLGKFDDPPSWDDVIKYFRGSELQKFLLKLKNDQLKVSFKPQFVEALKNKIGSSTVYEILTKCDEKNMRDHFIKELGLENTVNRKANDISGGELQRLVIAAACLKEADIYIFDEPSSYLDVKQRLSMARMIRSIIKPTNYVIIVEHDLAILDYLSDYVCLLYGTPGVYGCVTYPFSVREGINVFLDGMIPTENMRFRTESLSFKMFENANEKPPDQKFLYKYPKMSVTLKSDKSVFNLQILPGFFNQPEIIVLLGENGMGKTTLIRILAGLLTPNEKIELPRLTVSYKAQQFMEKYDGTVESFLFDKIGLMAQNPQFMTDVMNPLKIKELMDLEVNNLSGGEKQRLAITVCLGTPASMYLLDEPSAYLDSEQRVICSKVIKRFIHNMKKTAFVVEHDFIMITYLADKIILYKGISGLESTASSPLSLVQGMNSFLEMQNVTLRRDPTNYRPRINKLNSLKDTEQKKNGTFFFYDA